MTASDLPADYDLAHRAGRVLALILDEIEIAPLLSLHVPMPRHPAIAAQHAAHQRTVFSRHAAVGRATRT